MSVSFDGVSEGDSLWLPVPGAGCSEVAAPDEAGSGVFVSGVVVVGCDVVGAVVDAPGVAAREAGVSVPPVV